MQHWLLLVWLQWSFGKEGVLPNICHSSIPPAWGQILFQLHQSPSPTSHPLVFQRSFLIVSVIEDWHCCMQCQAAKNKSIWLLASVVVGWLPWHAWLLLPWGVPTMLLLCVDVHLPWILLQWLFRVICGYLPWCKHKQKARAFHFYPEDMKGITN